MIMTREEIRLEIERNGKRIPLEEIDEKVVEESHAALYFKSNGTRFFLLLHYKPDIGYYARSIEHYYENEVKNDCPYCHGTYGSCWALNKYKHVLFERLILSNSIRLNWVYRTYTIE